MSESTEGKLEQKSETGKIVMIYVVVAIICVGIIAVSMWLGKKNRSAAAADVNDRIVVIHDAPTLEETIGMHDIMKLEEDFVATNQDGEEVTLQSLQGKVWVFAQFYGTCPECNKVNFTILKDLYEKYKGNPNFKIVAVSVQEEQDGVAAMKSMAQAVDADSSNWWFLTADVDEVNDFFSENMLYTRFVENTDKEGSGMQGAIFHDMGISVFNDDMIMKAKVDVYSVEQSGNKLGAKNKRKQLDLEVANALNKI